MSFTIAPDLSPRHHLLFAQNSYLNRGEFLIARRSVCINDLVWAEFNDPETEESELSIGMEDMKYDDWQHLSIPVPFRKRQW